MEAIAIKNDIRVTPRKMRLVIDLVRGKNIQEAYVILKNCEKAAAHDVYKVVKSAASNAVNNQKMNENLLFIKDIQAGDGVRLKRFMPRAKGSSSGIIKRTSNLRVIVGEKEQ